MNRGATVLLLAALAAAAGVAGFYLSRQLTGQPPPPVAAIAPAAIPAVRPVFTLRDTAGKPRPITEWDGRPLAINFWATWCPPCRREIPMLNALQRRHATDGLAVIGIAVDFREDVLQFLAKTPVEYTVLIGEQDGLDAARAFGMETMGFPFTVFTDRQGRILTIHVGELHEPEAEALLAALREVDGGRLPLAAARERIKSELAAIKARQAAAQPPGR